MNQPLRIGFVPIARPTFDVALASEFTELVRGSLHASGWQISEHRSGELILDSEAARQTIEALRSEPLDLLLILQATFADSSLVVEMAKAIDAPLLLWAIPEERTGGRLRLNSFCGINLAGHGLRRAGFKYDYVYTHPSDPAALAKIDTLARAGRARRLLRSASIGRVGEHPTGFDPCGYDPDELASQLGVSVVPLELSAFFDRVRVVPAAEAEAVREKVAARVAGLDQLEQKALRGTMSIYVALHKLAKEHGLAGLAVRCWPEFFTELGCAACGAMSLRSDEMSPCSCEADVNGTITQLILQWLSEGPAFGTDMVGFDASRDEAVLWHCGLAPLSMADPAFQPRGTVHSNRKLPLLMEFPLKPGRVTIARLSQATGAYRLVVGGGEMLRAPLPFAGTSGVIRFDRPAAEVLDTIMREGLDHHISITYGDHVAALLALANLLDLPVLRLA